MATMLWLNLFTYRALCVWLDELCTKCRRCKERFLRATCSSIREPLPRFKRAIGARVESHPSGTEVALLLDNLKIKRGLFPAWTFYP
jgi:hypothetical protein